MVQVNELSAEEDVMDKIQDQVVEYHLGLNEVKHLYSEECLN
jgi:hypothetical protein